MREGEELFELCKRVYEATGLSSDVVVDFYFDENGLVKSRFQALSVTKKELPIGYTPLYTTDYLLEKLQQSLKHKNDQISVFNDSKGWSAKLNINFIDDDDIYHHRELNDSYGHNTPLKALLKLAIKLHEENII